MKHVSAIALAQEARQLVTPQKRAAPPVDDDTPSSVLKRLRRKTTVIPELTSDMLKSLREAVAVHGLAEQGNPQRQNFRRDGAFGQCKICGALRHHVKWATRMTGHGKSKTTGSQCYCCVKASLYLNCSRSLTILQAVPGAMRTFKLKSFELRHELRKRDDDHCLCADCTESAILADGEAVCL